MTATFLLPFAVGACSALGGSVEDIVTNAFGVVAMVAMTPLITIQILGLIYKLKQRNAAAVEQVEEDKAEIVDIAEAADIAVEEDIIDL